MLMDYKMSYQSSSPVEARLVDVRPLAAALAQFATERNWHQFHSPKNLVMALSGEVGELTELFQWMSEDASREACNDQATAQRVGQELADVLLYLVRLADVLGVDLNDAATNKLKLNAEKYPVGLAYGSSKKYDQL